MAAATSATRCPSSGPGVRTGMPIRIDNPRELGADRLVNAVAAYEKVGGPVRRRRPRHGADLRRRLRGRGVPRRHHLAGRRDLDGGADRAGGGAARRSTSTPPRALIGKGTVDAIRSGVIYGFAARSTAIVTRLRDELGEETEAIATGGLAHAIVPFCETIDDIDDLLTLDGLRIIWERQPVPSQEAGQLGHVAKTASPPATPKPSNPATTPEAEQRNMPVSSADLRILEAADALFSGPSKWNRHDDRSCTPRTPLGVCSVLCSAPLSKCSAVTTIDAWRFRRFGSPSKRLRRQLSSSIGWDYNNLQTTSFQDIKAVLHVARERVAGRLASMPK